MHMTTRARRPDRTNWAEFMADVGNTAPSFPNDTFTATKYQLLEEMAKLALLVRWRSATEIQSMMTTIPVGFRPLAYQTLMKEAAGYGITNNTGS